MVEKWHGKPNVLTVVYENLMKNPVDELQGVVGLFGVSFDRSAAERALQKNPVDLSRHKESPIDKDTLEECWREIETRVAPNMKLLGISPKFETHHRV